MTTNNEKKPKNYNRNKISIYLPSEVLEEIDAEAKRLDRTRSWMLKQAWKLSKQKMSEMPSYKD